VSIDEGIVIVEANEFEEADEDTFNFDNFNKQSAEGNPFNVVRNQANTINTVAD
jgi:hypothetical protein